MMDAEFDRSHKKVALRVYSLKTTLSRKTRRPLVKQAFAVEVSFTPQSTTFKKHTFHWEFRPNTTAPIPTHHLAQYGTDSVRSKNIIV